MTPSYVCFSRHIMFINYITWQRIGNLTAIAVTSRDIPQGSALINRKEFTWKSTLKNLITSPVRFLHPFTRSLQTRSSHIPASPKGSVWMSAAIGLSGRSVGPVQQIVYPLFRPVGRNARHSQTGNCAKQPAGKVRHATGGCHGHWSSGRIRESGRQPRISFSLGRFDPGLSGDSPGAGPPWVGLYRWRLWVSGIERIHRT